MTTTLRHTVTTISALAMAATTTLALAAYAPAAHAQNTDYATSASTCTADPMDIGEVVAYRKAQQAEYLVKHHLLDRR